MKKTRFLLALILLVCTISSCGGTNNGGGGVTPAVSSTTGADATADTTVDTTVDTTEDTTTVDTKADTTEPEEATTTPAPTATTAAPTTTTTTAKPTTTTATAKPTTTTTTTTTTTAKLTTTTTAKPTTTTTKAPEVGLVQYLGKTVGDVKRDCGNGFVFDGYRGSSLMNYEDSDFAFILEQYYSAPPESAHINYVVSYGTERLLGVLCGNMTYPEIAAVVGAQVSLKEPEYFYSELDGMGEYTLEFVYQGFTFIVTWLDDPNTAKSSDVFAYSPALFVTTTTMPTTTTTTPTYTTESPQAILLREAALKELNARHEEVIEFEFSDELDESVYYYVMTLSDSGFIYTQSVVMIDKNTKYVEWTDYKGNVLDEFYLP